MMYVLAILVPPLYFLIKKRWAAFVMTFGLMIISIFLLFSLYLAPLVPILWGFSAFIAVWDVRQKVLGQQ